MGRSRRQATTFARQHRQSPVRRARCAERQSPQGAPRHLVVGPVPVRPAAIVLHGLFCDAYQPVVATFAVRLQRDFSRRINRLRRIRPGFRSSVGLGGSVPWVRIPNLGSHILAIVRRRLPEDWTARYNITPVLIETFVETPRYTGTVHKASGWTRVGATQGARAIRPAYQTSPAEKGHLAPIPPKRLAAHPQSVETSPGAVGRVCTCQGADNCLLIP